MRDWRKHIQGQLEGTSLDAAAEAEIMEAWEQHLEDRYRELRAAGAAETEAARLALQELRGAEALANALPKLERRRGTNVVPGFVDHRCAGCPGS